MINIFENLDKAIDLYSHYENVLLVGDLNAEILEFCLDSFLYQHELRNLVKEKTCFKNVSNPSCIDLSSFTNNVLSFQHMETVSAGLSDFHKSVLTVLKTTKSYSLGKQTKGNSLQRFDSLKFNVDLTNALAHEKIESCIKFDEVFMKVLNTYDPLRANHSSYISKTLRKATMRRSYLEKKYFFRKNASVS